MFKPSNLLPRSQHTALCWTIFLYLLWSFSPPFLDLHRSQHEWSIETHSSSSLSVHSLLFTHPPFLPEAFFCTKDQEALSGTSDSIQGDCCGDSSTTYHISIDIYEQKDTAYTRTGTDTYSQSIPSLVPRVSLALNLKRCIVTFEGRMCNLPEVENSDKQISVYSVMLGNFWSNDMKT